MAQRSAAELVKQELKLGRMIASNLILIINASLLSSSLETLAKTRLYQNTIVPPRVLRPLRRPPKRSACILS